MDAVFARRHQKGVAPFLVADEAAGFRGPPGLALGVVSRLLQPPLRGPLSQLSQSGALRAPRA